MPCNNQAPGFHHIAPYPITFPLISAGGERLVGARSSSGFFHTDPPRLGHVHQLPAVRHDPRSSQQSPAVCGTEEERSHQ